MKIQFATAFTAVVPACYFSSFAFRTMISKLIPLKKQKIKHLITHSNSKIRNI